MSPPSLHQSTEPGRKEPEDPHPTDTAGLDTENIKHNTISRECILFSEDEGLAVGRLLKKKNLVHIYTDPQFGDCFYEAILTSLSTPTVPEIYTATHLKWQICMFMINNYEHTTKQLKLRLQAFSTSLAQYIEKFMALDEWGEDWLLYIVHSMWKKKITIIDVTSEQTLKHYGKHKTLKAADIVLIYNGNDHFTGTGNVPYPLLFFFLHGWL